MPCAARWAKLAMLELSRLSVASSLWRAVRVWRSCSRRVERVSISRQRRFISGWLMTPAW
jgi:hypothetical protein